MSDTLGRILEREPDWSALPAATPGSIRTLLERCLSKDARRRTRDIGDVRIELDALETARTTHSPETASSALSDETRDVVAMGCDRGPCGRRGRMGRSSPARAAPAAARERPVYTPDRLGWN
jgi:hypothetical protein